MKSRAETAAKDGILSRGDFLEYSERFSVVPLVQRLALENRDALDVYVATRKAGCHSILLESGETGGGAGRYSFIATKPERLFRVAADGFEEIDDRGAVLARGTAEDFDRRLREYTETGGCPLYADLPPFAGGVAGFFGYGMVSHWEDLFHWEPSRSLRESSFPDALLMGFASVCVVDHLEDEICLVRNVRIPEGADRKARMALYDEARRLLDEDAANLPEPGGRDQAEGRRGFCGAVEATISKERFLSMVRQGKEHILAGDVCQVVLSQRFSAKTDLEPLEIYRALKRANPSPYMFYLDLGAFRLIGSSPEVLVRLSGDRITTRPLAGTRKRGKTPAEDRTLEQELLADEKERAEHVMLVDLSRNDLGKVCRTKTVEVTELMETERYSQVMHIVSNVEGERRAGCGPLEILRAAFPAGTVSGAPKVRAMEIIEDLEPSPRGPYAGAVGYIGFGGDMDTCITIRTFLHENGRVHVQAGAGIVYDSVPETEYEETKSKARALFKALEDASGGRGVRS
ncbi:MAG: anthranilate synthase component I family protein [Thermovirgaceae bacterium]